MQASVKLAITAINKRFFIAHLLVIFDCNETITPGFFDRQNEG